MSVVNHIVRSPSRELQIAMIRGTKVRAWCGIQFVPEVEVGTSGRADVPGAPTCPRCQQIVDSWREYIRLKDEKARLDEEMHAIETKQLTLLTEWREERQPVTSGMRSA